MNIARTIVSAVEYFLRHPEKLKDLEPSSKRLFYDQRSWHPLVRFKWTSETEGGDGILRYPDGSIATYELKIRPEKPA